MQTVNIHEAKTHLSRLIEQAARGEPFVIAKAGKPLVKGHGVACARGRTTAAFGLYGRANRRARGFRPDGERRDRAAVR